MLDSNYYKKYIKYKKKYLELKTINQIGGNLSSKEVIEVIYKSKHFKLNSTKETIDFLKKYKLFKSPNETFYVFDLHNVLDLLDQKYQIKRTSDKKVICCSYVGRYSPLRDTARSEIKERIKSGQIDWGVLVFRRGKERRNENPFLYHKEGSKSWFCNLIKGDYFFDDSKDHVESVKSTPNLNIKVIQILNRKKLIEQIEKLNFNFSIGP
tara:strand:- start:251 stop:880 length:630 start_codon:yes stop_codon:yes gene_type:complete